MKKALVRFFIILLCCIIATPITAGALEYSVVYSNNGDGTCTVIGGNITTVYLMLPETYNGLTVIAIGYRAFENEQYMSQVYLPDSIVFIGESAFMYSQFLDTIEFGNGLEYIGKYAFAWCVDLGTISLPDSLTYIGYGALTVGFLPEYSGESVEWYEFDNHGKTGRIFHSGHRISRDIYYGYGINVFTDEINPNNTSTIRKYTGTDQTIELPETLVGLPVTHICDDAFANKNINTLDFGSHITYIGHGAFSNNNLTAVTIPQNATHFGIGAFSGNQFSEFVLPDGDWQEFDENGFTGNTIPGGQSVSVDLGYTTQANNKPWRKSSVPSSGTGSVIVNDPYSLDLSTIFEDDFEDQLIYEVSVNGADYISATENYTFVPPSVGEHQLVFKAFDRKEYSDDTYTINLTSRPVPVNYPTLKSGVPPRVEQAIKVKNTYSLDLSTIFEDSHHYPLSYQVNLNGSGFADIDENFSFSPTEAGDYSLIFRAYNGGTYSVETYEVDLDVMQTCSITYDANGASSGSVPRDGASPYISGSDITIRSNTGALAKTDHFFNGWNTNPDGSGIHFDADGSESFTILSDTTLYAEWAEHKITSGGIYDVSDYQTFSTPLSAGNRLTIDTTEPVTLTGTAPGTDAVNGIKVVCNEGTHLTLKDYTNNSPQCGLTFTGVNNKLFLDGTNETRSHNTTAAVRVGEGSELTIDNAQGTTGSLYAKSAGSGAGIGGNNNEAGGQITINGGEISAVGGLNGAGIGGGNNGRGGDIRITGGKITTRSDNNGAGIGGGNYNQAGTITITGGEIVAQGAHSAAIGAGQQASGGVINISGGDITATGGSNSAAIGSSGDSGGNYITISGGEISATGGDYGVGIGGRGINSFITITGGDIQANGGLFYSGIGGSSAGYVTISGGTIDATGGEDGAGIGGGRNANAGTILISGGKITANGGESGAGIGGGYDTYDYSGDGKITITGGDVLATGGIGACGIGGGGNAGNGGEIRISGGRVAGVAGSGTASGIGGSHGDITGVYITDGAIVYAQGGHYQHYALGRAFYNYPVGYDDTLISGESTVFFKGTGMMLPYTRYEGGVSSQLLDSHRDNALQSLGLRFADPWKDAEKVFCARDVEFAHIWFSKNTTDTVTDLPMQQFVVNGAKINRPPNPSREGYTFSGWYEEEACINEWNFDVDTAADTVYLYAKWEKELTVSVSAGANGFVAPNGSYTVLEGDDFIITPMPNTNCELDEVTSTTENSSISDNGDGTFTVNNITSGGTIYVSFTAGEEIDDTVYHTVSIDAGPNGSINLAGDHTVADGGSLTFTASPDHGYSVDSITSTASYASFIENINGSYTVNNITSAGTITVNFKQTDFIVDIVAGPNGTVIPSGQCKVAEGASKTIYAFPDGDYEVDVVRFSTGSGSIDSHGNDTYTINNITSAGTIFVDFALPEHTVEVTVGAYGSVTPVGLQTVIHGDSLILTPAPYSGFEVDQITSTTGNTIISHADGSYEIQNISASCHVHVSFKPQTFTASYDSAGGNGSVSDSTGTFMETIVLSDGVGLSRPKAVLERWSIGYLGGLYQMTGDVTANAVWANDTDEDGISDSDEIAAGTDPRDPEDTPQEETIKVTILNDDGSFASNYTIVLNSAPQFNTTGSGGNAVFPGVSLSPHTLSLRDGTKEIGRYPLSFTKGSSNNSTITGGGTGVSTTNAPNFLSLELVIRLNAAKTSGTIIAAAVRERSDQIDNPNTGEY